MYTPTLFSLSAGPRLPHRRGGAAATPMAFVRAVVQVYAQRGMDPGAALQAAQITPGEVAHEDARITAWQMEALCGAAMHELDDEALGWFERRLPWGSYGMLARASISAPHLGLALARWCRHHRLLADAITLSLSADGAGAAIAIAEHRPLGAGGSLREFCLVSVLRNIHGLACWFVDSRLPLRAVEFPFEAPVHASTYSLLFPGPVGFGAAQAAIHFDSSYLALPLARDEAALRQMLRRALPLTVLQYRHERLLSARVRQLLADDPATLQGATLLAERLNLSPRTLHRQLRQEGSSLQQLKNEVRLGQARQLLRHSDRPIKLVALAAGYANEKSFIRAFRGWTGMAPAQWRAQSRGGV
ncbi:AraC family transcriptional regulator [Comamonas badia]|uniref:AraC family transcriptional regulator n=1 Tax=Comamonas badia TaxID=265291 RepID=UPI0004646A03